MVLGERQSLPYALASASLTVSQPRWKRQHLSALGTLLLWWDFLGPLGQLPNLYSRTHVP